MTLKFALIAAADNKLNVLGFNEHGFRHASHVADIASRILEYLAFDSHPRDLAKIASFLHDIGNAISQRNPMPPQARRSLTAARSEGMATGRDRRHYRSDRLPWNDYGSAGIPTDPVPAALILVYKTDVHRSRVRITDASQFDLHNRVGFAVLSSSTCISSESNTITLEFVLDVRVATGQEFRELFGPQMGMCRTSAAHLGCTFDLFITDVATD